MTARRLLFSMLLLAPSPALAQGAILETMEDLAARPEAPSFRGTLPAQVDLSATLPPPGDQGATGSCVSWAATYAAASQAARRAGLGANLRLSPSFTYNQISRDPFCSAPSPLSTVLDFLGESGTLPIEEFAFDGGWCGRLPITVELQRAAKYKIKSWSKIDPTKMDSVKAQLARGVPVVFGINADAELKALQGDKIYDPPGISKGFGHELVAVGYDDARKAFRVQNSWGRKWADGGYGWISYGFWTRNVKLAVVID
jgi:C1A family cysteine protease